MSQELLRVSLIGGAVTALVYSLLIEKLPFRLWVKVVSFVLLTFGLGLFLLLYTPIVAVSIEELAAYLSVVWGIALLAVFISFAFNYVLKLDREQAAIEKQEAAINVVRGYEKE